MPTDLAEAASSGATELIFPDDATRYEYRLREGQVYDAEEVRGEIGNSDVPQWGNWLPVEIEDGEAWLNAPSQLITELVEIGIEPGHRWTVDRLEKTGSRQSDPYEVELSVHDEDQGRLTS